jgi:hypothetical protein
MRRHIRTPSPPVRHRPRPGAFAAARHDFLFAVGVVADSLRNRPFTS